MNISGFSRFAIGFLFIMFDFKFNGIDILPDVIGYLFFAAGFNALNKSSIWFEKGGRFNIPMILISLVYIYEPPAKQGQMINFGPLGLLGIPVGIAAFVLGLMVVYYLFMGIKDLAARHGKPEILEEADRRWRQFLTLTLASILMVVLIIFPILALPCIIILLVISIGLMVAIMRFMGICRDGFQDISAE